MIGRLLGTLKSWEIIADNLSKNGWKSGSIGVRENITLALAIIGAGLGIWNTIANFRKDRISLRVIPKLYDRGLGGFVLWDRFDPTFHPQFSPSGRAAFCVEVQNAGRIAVTLNEVGFIRKRRSGNRFVIVQPRLSDGSSLPKRLDPLSSVTVYSSVIPEKLGDLHQVKAACAEAANGKIFTGSSPVLKQLVRTSRKSARA